ncbi:hypothetical protein [Hymenobacter arizonensis]|uniref:Uncharacterized protein n=1 Tax=Hymenobacter arizonensis TaxID=1227077 RepID=A0A1I5UVM1_HYMAR|nr:hypothetical protein [Hymenobacter arizonensis]SFP99249.1 hypothetical protein SAMN04515668_1089 [Hymenobacter arizonensis]
MTEISTQHLAALPNIEALQRLCKSLATLDAIICREWENRYYSYSNAWDTSKQEECFQMRNGSGDEFQVLFSLHGSIINGQAHESEMCNWSEKKIHPITFKEKVSNFFGHEKIVMEQQIWEGVIDTIPNEFKEFILGEPVKSIGTTFCIWRKVEDKTWHIGAIKFPKSLYNDGSADLLYIFDGKPTTYWEWATEYYEEQFDGYQLELELVKHIYDLKPLTKEVVVQLNPSIDDFEQLKTDLSKIGYAYIDL